MARIKNLGRGSRGLLGSEGRIGQVSALIHALCVVSLSAGVLAPVPFATVAKVSGAGSKLERSSFALLQLRQITNLVVPSQS
jgi:hypothetical protein